MACEELPDSFREWARQALVILRDVALVDALVFDTFFPCDCRLRGWQSFGNGYWFKWLKEDSLEDADDLPEPEELATDAISELEGAVEELNAVLALLETAK